MTLPRRKKDTDEQVEKMVKDWDIVRCKICRRKISLLNAISVNGGEYFICESCK